MKKILNILLLLSIITSCEDDNQPASLASPPSSSSACGNVSVQINSSNVNYNPDINSCMGGNIYSSSTLSNVINLNFSSYIAGTTQVEYQITMMLTASPIQIGQTYSVSGMPGTDPYPTLGLLETTWSPNFNQKIYANQIYILNPNGGELNGSVTITNIDSINQKVDGNLSFTAYEQVSGGSSKTIAVTFSDVPFSTQ